LAAENDRAVRQHARRRGARVRATAGRYKEARRVLRTPASNHSRRGLDWLNFFIADVQTGFGSFVAFYLSQLGWPEGTIGLALGTGNVAALLCQIPGGIIADAVTWKRGLAAAGILMIGGSALIFALMPNLITVFFAEILHGATAGVITPAITAMSLGIVGRSAMSLRTGRNYRYAAAGHALTAAMMGVAGAYVSKASIFLSAAALCIPALIALSFIRSNEIDYAKARNASTREGRVSVARLGELSTNRGLVVFTVATALFQLADASMLPLIGEKLAGSFGARASLWMSGLVITPQIVVAILAPWLGYHSEKRGRKPLLLVGFGIEVVRGILLAFTADYPFLVVAQIFDGISGATISVLTILVITDLTVGTGRFNLTRGAVGAISAVAATVSTSTTGFLFKAVGHQMGFFILAAIAAAAAFVLWRFLAETKPEKYED
jgi:MFS family permease